MAQQNGVAPGDRPRRPGEHVVTWALATGRIGPERADFWVREVAASAPAATHVLELLAPGTAVPLTSAGALHPVAAAKPAGRSAAELTEEEKEAALFTNHPRNREVAAAAVEAAEAESDPGYDLLFGDTEKQAAQRHLEQLGTIASGGAIGGAIGARQARGELERLAQAGGTADALPGSGLPPGRRVHVSADAAQKALDRLDRQTDVRWAR